MLDSGHAGHHIDRAVKSVNRKPRGPDRVLDHMVRACFDGQVIAESDDVKMVEGIPYFPIDSVDRDVLIESPTTSRCFWKGKARYWHVQGGDDIAQNAAFMYERPWPLAKRLVTDRVAFWQGVEVTRD